MSFSTLQEPYSNCKPDTGQGEQCPSSDPFGEGLFLSQNHPSESAYSLIHGNNSSTPHKQGLHRPFDDFNPDHSELALIDRLNRYATAHSRAVDMSKYIRELFRSPGKDKDKRVVEKSRAIATELQECGSYLHFHHYYTINQVKLASMCSCKRHLLCPLCAIRRAAKTVKAYMEKYQILVSDNPHLSAYLVTFTVKDGEDLGERFEHLQKSLRLYYDQRRKAEKGKTRNKQNEANKAAGGVGSYEVKRGQGSGIWHPHAHYIWLCESKPDVSQIKAEWQEITGDSFIVDVTPFYDQENVSKGFLEVFKYALKYSTMSLSDNWEAYNVLQGRRLVSSFGIFRGVEVPEQMTDEISFDDLPYLELVFRYLGGKYQLTTCTPAQACERSE